MVILKVLMASDGTPARGSVSGVSDMLFDAEVPSSLGYCNVDFEPLREFTNAAFIYVAKFCLNSKFSNAISITLGRATI